MALQHTLALFGVQVVQCHMIPWPPPQFQWVKEITLASRRWTALQTWVFFKALCQGNDGLLCEVRVTGRHEFLRSATTFICNQVMI